LKAGNQYRLLLGTQWLSASSEHVLYLQSRLASAPSCCDRLKSLSGILRVAAMALVLVARP